MSRAEALRILDGLAGRQIVWYQDTDLAGGPMDRWIAFDPIAQRRGAVMSEYRIAIVQNVKAFKHQRPISFTHPWQYTSVSMSLPEIRYFKTLKAAQRAAEKDWRAQ